VIARPDPAVLPRQPADRPIWDLPDPSGTPSLFDLLPGHNGDQAAEVDVEALQEILFTAMR